MECVSGIRQEDSYYHWSASLSQGGGWGGGGDKNAVILHDVVQIQSTTFSVRGLLCAFSTS